MGIYTAIKQESSALWGDGKGPSLVAIAGTWGILLGTRMAYPVLLPYLRDQFELSLTVAGLLVTVLWFGSAVGQLPSGLIADRYSERLVMAVSSLSVALSIGLVVIAPSRLVLFAGTGLVGLGQSMYPIARITILSEIYPGRIGSALGMTMATGDLGQALIPPVVGVIAAAIAWQVGLGLAIPLLLAGGVALWLALPSAPNPRSNSPKNPIDRIRTLMDAMRGSNLPFVSAILFLFFFSWQSFTGFFPTYLVEQKGLSSASAGLLFSAFFAFGALVKPVAGAAYDRIGMRTALVIVLIGPVGGLLALPFVEGFWALAAVTAIVSTMLGSGAITQSYLSDAFPTEIRGTGLGVVRTVVAALGAMGPVVFGSVADRGYFDEGYLLLAGILTVVILLTLRLPTSSVSAG